MQSNSKTFWQWQKDVSVACLPQYLTEGSSSVEHHKGGAQSWSSVTTSIKNGLFCFYLSPASIWHFPGCIVCLSPTIVGFMKKKKSIYKPVFGNYGKPTAGGSHRLGSRWSCQLLLDKHFGNHIICLSCVK